MRTTAVRAVGLVLAAALSMVVAGCADDQSGSVVDVTTTSSDPTDVSDPASMAFTNTVTIKEGAVEPRQAVALIASDLEFENATSSVQEVQLSLLDESGNPVRSGPIEPGASFSYTQETPVSLAYDVLTQPGVRGQIQVDPGVDTL